MEANEELLEEKDLTLEKGYHIIKKEELPTDAQEELEKLIELTGDEISEDDMPDELRPELTPREVKDIQELLEEYEEE